MCYCGTVYSDFCQQFIITARLKMTTCYPANKGCKNKSGQVVSPYRPELVNASLTSSGVNDVSNGWRCLNVKIFKVNSPTIKMIENKSAEYGLQKVMYSSCNTYYWIIITDAL